MWWFQLFLFYQKKLWEAFVARNEKLFDRWLEVGANPEQIAEQDTKLSTFELLCKTPNAGDYILKCLDYKANPNRVSSLRSMSVWKQHNAWFLKDQPQQRTLSNSPRCSALSS
jgi:hypothetical protein